MTLLSNKICKIIYIAITILVIIGISVGIYNSFHRKHPSFTLYHAAVHSFNLTSDGHLTSFFDIIIRVTTKDKKINLSQTHVSIYKDKQNLAGYLTGDFIQRKHTVTYITAEPIAIRVLLNKGPRFDFEMENGEGHVEFDVFMRAKLDGDNLEVNCKGVVVNASTSSFSVNPLIASSPSSSGDRFRMIDCSVRIYADLIEFWYRV